MIIFLITLTLVYPFSTKADVKNYICNTLFRFMNEDGRISAGRIWREDNLPPDFYNSLEKFPDNLDNPEVLLQSFASRFPSLDPYRWGRSFIPVQPEDTLAYVKEVGESTVEILHASDAYNGTGHMMLRLGSDVYHIHSVYGVIKEPFDYVVNNRFADYRIDGVLLKTSEREREFLSYYFRYILTKGNNIDLKFFTSNCSQTTCRHLDRAGIVEIKEVISLDPSISFFATSMTSRAAGLVVHNPQKSLSMGNHLSEKLINRGLIVTIYTSPVLAPLALYYYFSSKDD